MATTAVDLSWTGLPMSTWASDTMVPQTGAIPGMDTGAMIPAGASPTNPAPPAAAPAGAAAKPAGGGLNWGNAGDIMTGLASLAGVWAAFQQNKIARDQLNFNKSSYNTNLANQTQSYNTALQDRISSRYVQEGKSAADAQAYIDANKL